ncbi:hypothetical protein [uncultured Mucilaginibacter sp.]|uniref:hypothetical protein n=1 Tax=uncultured Mucilaginibacter sp. TaxID=797541 RepID=UPI002611A336|nr:hypothetical protein [uncultured Mucilaginibacter sp.]
MKNSFTFLLLSAAILILGSCNHGPGNTSTKKTKKRQPVNYANYIIEIITCKTRKDIRQAEYVRLDSLVQQLYVQKQPGYISSESGVDQKGNWLVVLSWDNIAHADAGRQKFLQNPLWTGVQKLIDTTTLNRKRFVVKEDHSNSLKDQKPYVIELATFKEKRQVVRDTFEKRDQQVEAEYISRQTGYITRRIGVAPDGERLMMIYWKTLTDADNGMKEFLKEQSVADYAKMIDWPTVDLKRFQAIN